MIGVAHGFLIVLDNHKRVSLSSKCGEGVEQAQIISGMQTDGRLIEHVKHAAQIRAQLRG